MAPRQAHLTLVLIHMKISVQEDLLFDANTTIEKFLIQFGITPRSKLKEAFVKKQVRLNERVADRHALVHNGDSIEILSDSIFQRNAIALIPNSTLNLPVLFETAAFVAFQKPAGISCHPLHPNESNTALNGILAHFPECGVGFEKPLEGGLVHRLDKGTSGILVCARNIQAWKQIKTAWKNPEAEKVYLAKLARPLKQIQPFQIHCFLSHDLKSKKKMVASLEAEKNEKSWEAKTSVFPLSGTHCLVRIHTGVTHQIRATLQSLGSPVLGDDLYAEPTKFSFWPKTIPLSDAERGLFQNIATRIPSQQNGLVDLPTDAFFLHALWLCNPLIAELPHGLLAPLPNYFELKLFLPSLNKANLL